MTYRSLCVTQLQNDCMRDEYRSLLDDIDLDFEWVSLALNRNPEGRSLPIPNSYSFSSTLSLYFPVY